MRRVNVYTEESYPQEHGYLGEVSTAVGYLIGTVVGQEILKRRYKKEISEYYRRQRESQHEEGPDGNKYFKSGDRYFQVLPEYELENMSIPELHRLALTVRYSGIPEGEFQKRKTEGSLKREIGEALEKSILYTIERQGEDLTFTDTLQWYSMALSLSNTNPRLSKSIIEKLNEVYDRLLRRKEKEKEKEKEKGEGVK